MVNRKQKWWDNFFLGLAQYISSASKDPSTKVGAVIVKGKNQIISTGYNGFAKQIKDTDERLNNRDLKYRLVIHAEENAVRFAGHSVEGCTLYTWPFMCCSKCASRMIHEGIARHVAPHCPKEIAGRWGEDLKFSQSLFKEAGVEVVLF